MRERLGFWAGLAGFCLLLLLPAPDGMGADAWRVTALAFLMACWWMTEALPLTATALLPFALLPLLGVSTPSDVAASFYSPILFLVLGGALMALALGRPGLHRRLELAIVWREHASHRAIIFAFMAAPEFGSAVCRGRVCEFVYISVVLVRV